MPLTIECVFFLNWCSYHQCHDMVSLFYKGKGIVTTYWLLDAEQKPIHKHRRSQRVPNGIPSDSPLLSLPGFKSSLAGSSTSIGGGLKRSPSLRRSQFRSSQGSPVLKRWQKLEDPPISRQSFRDSFHIKQDPNSNQKTNVWKAI